MSETKLDRTFWGTLYNENILYGSQHSINGVNGWGIIVGVTLGVLLGVTVICIGEKNEVIQDDNCEVPLVSLPKDTVEEVLNGGVNCTLYIIPVEVPFTK